MLLLFAFLPFLLLLPPLSTSLCLLGQPPLAESQSTGRSAPPPDPSSSPVPSDSECNVLRRLLCSSFPSFPSAGGCPPPSPNIIRYPYAGWVLSGPSTSAASSSVLISLGGKGQQHKCSDRSAKCAEFADLCPEALYRLFMSSHCAKTCGHCGDLPVATTGKGGGEQQNGQKGVRAPTKRRGIGEGPVEGSDGSRSRWWWGRNSTTTTMRTVETSRKTKEAEEKVEGGDGGKEAEGTEGTTTAKEAKKGRRRTTTTEGMMTTETEEATTTRAEPEEECEDVGENCGAMERMCGDIGQRHIMGSFCRKTCNLC